MPNEKQKKKGALATDMTFLLVSFIQMLHVLGVRTGAFSLHERASLCMNAWSLRKSDVCIIP